MPYKTPKKPAKKAATAPTTRHRLDKMYGGAPAAEPRKQQPMRGGRKAKRQGVYKNQGESPSGTTSTLIRLPKSGSRFVTRSLSRERPKTPEAVSGKKYLNPRVTKIKPATRKGNRQGPGRA